MAGLEKTNKPLYDWSVFFSDVNNREAMEQITHPGVKEAFEILKSVSATAQERLEAERRITYVRELNAIAGYQWDEHVNSSVSSAPSPPSIRPCSPRQRSSS